MKNKKDRYDHKIIDSKWREYWFGRNQDSVNIDDAKKPYYNLMMFPYPSAEGLHVGNVYAFTGSDIYGRYKRMLGLDVFEPIGLDGFGIHSENYALKAGRHPAEHAKITQKNFYDQLKRIGAMFDWEKTVETYNPDYYKWTQWLFIKMFKRGLAYRKRANVNFCPSCKTVLADEQVIDGKCERCGNSVEDKLLEQWFFRITAYAEKLLRNILRLKWSEKVKIAQTNWIGKKQGIIIDYPIIDNEDKTIETVSCFTTRPDTNFGAAFIAIAPEHPIISQLVKVLGEQKSRQIKQYIKKSQAKSNAERIDEGRKKTGIDTGLFAVNRLNNQKLPIYISDFVLMDYGTGAVVGVPAHDERDYDFACQFGLPVKKVVNFDHELHGIIKKDHIDGKLVNSLKKIGVYIEERSDDYAFVASKSDVKGAIDILKKYIKSDNGYAQVDGIHKGLITKEGILTEKGDIHTFMKNHSITNDMIYIFDEKNYKFCYTGDGISVNSDFLNGLKTVKAIEKINKFLETKKWGFKKNTYHLRDWLISRQRYWGPPIPMIYCRACADKKKSWFTSGDEKGYQSSSSIAKEKIEDKDKMYGWYPVKETDLPVYLPKIKDFKPEDDGVAPLSKVKDFYEVKCPECGSPAKRETDVSDTFLDSSWYYLRYPSVYSGQAPSTRSARSGQAPFDKDITKKWLPVDMYTGGAEHSVLHLLYSRFITMALNDFGLIDFEEPFVNFFAHGLIIKDGVKMSKSRGNVVNPDEYIESYGIDALRCYLMFMGPFSQGGDFNDSAMEGMRRWVGRVWRMGIRSIKNQKSKIKDTNYENIEKEINKLIKKVGEDIEARKYNTAISAMMEFTNLVAEIGGAISLDVLKQFLLVLAPFAPYITEELYYRVWLIKNNKDNGSLKLSNSGYKSIHLHQFPDYDKALIFDNEVKIAVQINGKTRDVIRVKKDDSCNQAQVEEFVKKIKRIQKYLSGREIKKTIFVPGRIINFVIKN